MNSNFFHNILNALIVIVGLATVLGCTVNVAGVYDCSASWLGAQWGAYLAIGFGALKIVINVLRDGLGGLIAAQPPVVK
jgi:hypothetical protein